MRHLRVWAAACAITAASGCSAGSAAPKSALPSPQLSSTAAVQRPCPPADVVCGGAYGPSGKPSLGILLGKLQSGDGRHSGGQLVASYARFFNVKAGLVEPKLRQAVPGDLARNGNVLVAGKVVATGAFFATRRQAAGGSLEIGGLFLHKSAELPAIEVPAFVVLQNGRFLAGILIRNGDPIEITGD